MVLLPCTSQGAGAVNMIERVARVLCEAKCRTLNCRCGAWELHENTARDSIAAMREPTNAMIVAASAPAYHQKRFNDIELRREWQTMIDSALE